MGSYINEGSILMRNESLLSGVLFFLLTYRWRERKRQGCWGMESSIRVCKTRLCCSLAIAEGVSCQPSNSPQCQDSPNLPSTYPHPTCLLKTFPSLKANLPMGWDPEIPPSTKCFLLMEAKRIKADEYHCLSTIIKRPMCPSPKVKRCFSWSSTSATRKIIKWFRISCLKLFLFGNYVFFHIFI